MGTQRTYGDGWGSTKGDLDNLKATDDATGLISKLDDSKPKDGWFRRYWPEGNLRYEWEYKNGRRAESVKNSELDSLSLSTNVRSSKTVLCSKSTLLKISSNPGLVSLTAS